MAWSVESVGARITETMAAALEEPRQKPGRRRSSGSKWVIGLIAAGVVVVVLGTITPKMNQSSEIWRAARAAKALQQSVSAELASPANHLIVHTAQLALTTREFDRARGAVEDILKRHQGYIGHLNVYAPAGAGRSLDASLRVPADQLAPTMAEIKRLGRVEMESQSGEEVTSQYIDLSARLANARNTERRLTNLLQQRTGKLADVLAVEVELGRVRGEIERMEAEKKSLTNRVDFSTLTVTVREDYQALIPAGPFSIFTRFRNATVEGYRSTAESLIAAVTFLLSYGPVVVLWAGILFLPARFVWRRLRRNPTYR
jgi:hypothetical protein